MSDDFRHPDDELLEEDGKELDLAAFGHEDDEGMVRLEDLEEEERKGDEPEEEDAY